MHITSNVTGELGRRADGDGRACGFRCRLGTVSGAPKVRAMQIIDEVEPTRRGPYGGAVGYVDFAGNMDTCIALRTIVWKSGDLRRAGRRGRRRGFGAGERIRRDDEQGEGDAEGGGDRGEGVLSKIDCSPGTSGVSEQ